MQYPSSLRTPGKDSPAFGVMWVEAGPGHFARPALGFGRRAVESDLAQAAGGAPVRALGGGSGRGVGWGGGACAGWGRVGWVVGRGFIGGGGALPALRNLDDPRGLRRCSCLGTLDRPLPYFHD